MDFLKNTDHGVSGVFIEEFYGSDFVERNLAIGTDMVCSIMPHVHL